MVLEATSLRRLRAMEIDVWQHRDGRPGGYSDRHADAAMVPTPRIRMEAGSGPWLLVLERGVADDQRTILDDLVATLGAAECRYGQWSDSADSGIALDECDQYGIRHVLAFGSAPVSDTNRLLAVPGLDELVASGRARRQLWSQLRRTLER
ncbi:MAG: hypothetical protein ABR550_01030 [Wenzhouxiangellaceae bacterium]